MSRQSLVALLVALLVAGCGGAPVASGSARDGQGADALNARGVPGTGPFRLLMLAGDGVDDVGFFGAWYGFVTAGWTVSVATPEPTAARTADGRPISGRTTLGAVEPGAFDMVFVPAGLPAGASFDAAIKGFAAQGIIVVGPGAISRAKAAGIAVSAPEGDGAVRIDGRVISAARTGDIPHLVWSSTAFAEDHLRGRVDAGGRDDPP